MAVPGEAWNGWSAHYGAVDVAGAYAGVSVRAGDFRGYWQHGVNMPFEVDVGEKIVPKDVADLRRYLVARYDEAVVLRRYGKPAEAVGVPFVYLDTVPVSRIRKSLLVVPTHTLAGQTVMDRSGFERYADEVLQYAARFEKVAVCVHAACLRNDLWVREFSERGVEVLLGADHCDANSLVRVKTLFSTFEHVTSNGWGSHIAYALSCGANVSIFGTCPRYSASEMWLDSGFQGKSRELEFLCSEEYVRRSHEFCREFLGVPGDGRINVELGRYLTGAENRLSRDAMKQLLFDVCEITCSGKMRKLSRKLKWRGRRMLRWVSQRNG